MYDFISLDVETANESPGSICQIGLAKFKDGQLSDVWETLVDPQDYFLSLNCAIHGIRLEDVAGAPHFPEAFESLQTHIGNLPVLHHTHFDRTAVNRACREHSLDAPAWRWLDTARVARRTWQQFQSSGYSLRNLCDHIGFDFEHHQAAEDAKAAGMVFLEACRVRGVEPREWLELVRRPITTSSRTRKSYDYGEGDPDGPLFGEVVCFTGTLETMRREDATALAKQAGCAVGDFTRKTTILVQGDQAVLRARGETISNKMRKAEEYARKGQLIRLMRESEFLELVGGSAK